MRKTVLALLGSLAVITPVLAVSGAAQAAGPARVVRWVDGDTVVTNHGTIRLIGVDTPERGRCGNETATRLAARFAPRGSTIRLGDPTTVRDHDRYGRKLRYVNRGSVDIGAMQISHGAWARYDSRDGYQYHSRQAYYHRLEARHRNYCGHKNPSSKSTSSPTHSTSGGVSAAVAPRGHNCPSYARIKGNRSSMIYHMPGQRFYAITTPEACFRNEASARAAGYRAAKI